MLITNFKSKIKSLTNHRHLFIEFAAASEQTFAPASPEYIVTCTVHITPHFSIKPLKANAVKCSTLLIQSAHYRTQQNMAEPCQEGSITSKRALT